MNAPQTPSAPGREKKAFQNSHVVKVASRAPSRAARAALLILFIAAVSVLATLPGSAARAGRASGAAPAPAPPEAAHAAPPARTAASAGLPSAAVWAAAPFFPPAPLAVETFAAPGCTTPQSSFNLGDEVCVKVSGAPTSGAAVVFSDTDNLQRSAALAVTASAQTFSLMLPSSANTAGLDNRGTWAASVVDTNDNSRLAVATFLVHDPNQAVADVTISKTLLDTTQVTAGNNTSYRVYVTNQGPDAASTVKFTDNTLPNTTFVSFTQVSGPTFTCTPPAVGVAGSTECTLASMAVGDVAVFTAVYKLNTGVSDGANLEDTIEIESSTFDSHESSNSSTTDATASNPTPPPCSLACPANISVGNDAGQAGAVVSFGSPAPTGTCGALTSIPASGSFFQIGSSVVTFTEAGGQSCSFSVTVTDEEDPSISCPGDITVEEKPAASGSANVSFNVTATDNGGAATVNCTPDSGSSFTVSGSPHSVTCIATDQSGNTSECNFNVTVKEATCTFTQPLDIVEDADVAATGSQACGANVNFTTPTATCPAEVTSTVTCDHASGSFFPLGDTVVTCKSNPDGATTSFTVTVKDITAPAPDVASLPTITGECSATAGIPTTVIVRDAFGNPIGTKIVNEPPTATDNCGGKILASTSDQRTYDEPGTYTVHWTYTDAAGNTATQEQTVKVTGPTGGLSITGPPVVVVHNPVGSGSCTVLISDIGAQMNTTVGGSCGGYDITRSVTPAEVDNRYDVGTTYTVVSTVTDGTNTSSVTQQLKIVDDTQPTISAPPNVTVNADAVSCAVPKASVPLGSPVVGAHCGVPTVANDAPAAFPLGETTVTWTVTDTSGNTKMATQKVTVVDHTAPSLNAPDIVVSNDPGSCSAVVNFTNLTASDNCGAVNVTTSLPSGSTFPKGTTQVSATATDASGNTTTKTFNVTVNDTEPPQVNVPADITVFLPLNTTATSMAVSYSVTISDNCGLQSQSVSPASGSIFPVGTTTVTATATDTSGNVTTKSFTVTVLFNFTGFFSPVDNPPVLNQVKAGQNIPIKFSLSGNKGLGILAAGSPASQQVNCSTNAPINNLDETDTPGNSTLTYDASSDRYQYNWKTEKSWAGTCRVLTVTLIDGTRHTTNFKFK